MIMLHHIRYIYVTLFVSVFICISSNICYSSGIPDKQQPTILSGHLRLAKGYALNLSGKGNIVSIDDIDLLSFTPDGKQIFTLGRSDGKIIIWNADNGKQIDVFPDDNSYFTAFSISPDGNKIATASGHKSVTLWDLTTRTVLCKYESNIENIYVVVFSPDGKQLAADWCSPIAFSPDRVKIYFTRHESVLWDIETGRVLLETKQSNEDMLEGYIVECRTGNILFKISGDEEYFTGTAAFTTDSKKIILLSNDHKIKILDSTSGEVLAEPNIHGGNKTVTNMAICPDGNNILFGFNDSTITFWNMETGIYTHSFPVNSSITSLAISPSGTRIICSSGNAMATVWDAKDGKNIFQLKGRLWPASDIDINTNGNYIGIGTDEGSIIVWDTQTGQVVKNINYLSERNLTHDDYYYGAYIIKIIFSHNDKYIASITGSIINIWDINNGNRTNIVIDMNMLRYNYQVRSIIFNKEISKLMLAAVSLAKADEDQINVYTWDLRDGTKVFDRILPLKIFNRVRFLELCRSGSWLLLGDDSSIIIFDLSSDKEIWRYKYEKSFARTGIISTDEKNIILGMNDNTAIIIDKQSGKKVLTLEGNNEPVEYVAFNPDGKKAITGSLFGSVFVWDIQKEKIIHSFKCNRLGITAIAFHPDNQHVIIGCRDGLNQLWNISTGQLVLNIMSLSDGDWVAYTPDGRYDGSEGGRKLVAFRVGEDQKLVPAEQMEKNYYQPGLLRDIMQEGASKKK
jgi:WD40 repeat protein